GRRKRRKRGNGRPDPLPRAKVDAIRFQRQDLPRGREAWGQGLQRSIPGERRRQTDLERAVNPRRLLRNKGFIKCNPRAAANRGRTAREISRSAQGLRSWNDPMSNRYGHVPRSACPANSYMMGGASRPETCNFQA